MLAMGGFVMCAVMTTTAMNVTNLERTKLMRHSLLYDYSITDIDNVAKDIAVQLADSGIPYRLAILAICRSLVMVGRPIDLDVACTIIDDLSEIEADRVLLERD